MYDLSNNKLKSKLDIQETAYINNSYIFKINLYLYFYFILIFLIQAIWVLFGSWTFTKTTTIMWKTTSKTIILDNLSLINRFYELWFIFLIPFLIFLIFLWIIYYRKKFYKNHIVFIHKIKDNKIYLHRYK